MQTNHTTTEVVSPKLGGWVALALFVLWLLAFINAAVIQSQAFPKDADRFIPAKIQANALATTLDATLQLALGTVLVALALSLNDYLATPLTTFVRLGLVAGIVAGVCFVIAGAGLEDIIHTNILLPQFASGIAKDLGIPDYPALSNATSLIVFNTMRAPASYALGWAMVLWSIAALRAKKLPAILNWIGIVAGTLFALTVWAGPIVGPFAFLGLLVWHLWLGIALLRAK